jgi:hypothetical protein
MNCTEPVPVRLVDPSMRAALIYQHATSKRDQEIAAAIERRSDAAMTANARSWPVTTRLRSPVRGSDGISEKPADDII